MTKVLITGATGFVGSHLIDYLTSINVEVAGIKRPRSREEFIHPGVTYFEGDVTDYTAISSIFRHYKPDIIFHLAAQSFVPASWQQPAATLHANIDGTLTVLEAVRQVTPDAIIQVAGSSEEYGEVYPEECPITEDQPLRPLSPYGVSKVTTEQLARVYWKSYGVKTIITRAFNHEGPRRTDCFVTSSFAKQIAEIEAGLNHQAIIKHGNLDAVRDYTDVRDMVQAYWLAAHKCFYGVPYNICSGKGWKIHDVLTYLILKARVPITAQVDPARLRPSDVPLLLGDSTPFRIVTGWQPEIPFEKTLDDTLSFWREDIKNKVERWRKIED